jgi:hypothetical protein
MSRPQPIRPAGRVGRFVTAVLAGLGFAALAAAPAAAHGTDAPEGTDYRTEVTAVTPVLPGLTVRVVESGARLELVNRTGRPIEVLGYAGEPYLEVRPDGVYENANSPATYLNRSLATGIRPPANADPMRPPAWRRISTEPVARWHDRRTHWLEPTPPAAVAAGPDREHRIREWVVPLRDGVRTVEVRGTLDWLPPPDPLRWWGLSLLGAVAVAAVVGRPARPRRDRRTTVLLAGLLALAGTGAVVLAAASAAGSGATGAGEILTELLTAQIWPLLTGLAALAASGYALARRPSADFALALAGACLALFAGIANAGVFTRSVVPVPGPVLWARLVVVLLIAVGSGVALAGVLRLRATARSVPVDAGR